MSVELIHRPARSVHPPSRPDPHTLAPPAPLGDTPGGIPMQSLLPVVGSMSSIVMMTVLRGNPIMVVVGALILVVALVGGVGMALSTRGRRIRERKRNRTKYLEYLDTLRADYRERHADVRARVSLTSPPPHHLPALIDDPARVWERRPGDTDFLSCRFGVTTRDWFQISLPEDPNPVDPFDPTLTGEAVRAVDTCSSVPGIPAEASLSRGEVVTIVGEGTAHHEVARALIAQFVTFHAPSDVTFGALIRDEHRHLWPRLDLVPHLLDTDEWDGPLERRRIAGTRGELAALFKAELLRRAELVRKHGARVTVGLPPITVLIDSGTAPAQLLPKPDDVSFRDMGFSFISLVSTRLHEPDSTTLRITVHGHDGTGETAATRGTAKVETIGGEDPEVWDGVHLDPVTPELFAGCMAALAGYRLTRASRTVSGDVPQLDALDILEVETLDRIGEATWGRKTGDAFLTTRIGADDGGEALELDIKEAAQGGMGPHGICIGATGSGKSEFLRTLVLGLATSHGPEDLSMILVDYKGGAAFSPFESLPQVAGVIDNLEGEAGLIERAKASISGEVVRRQQQLKEAGTLSSITEYREERRLNPSLAPMPHLFIVLDEFGELLTAEPDFIDLLLQIGRIGRSIGVHMLLSSQRIEGGKLRGLDTYLSYRIGLRTFSEQESHTVLGTPDAYHLPQAPGSGYLKVDSTVYTRFQSGYVSGPAPQQRDRDEVEELPSIPFILPPDNTVAQQLEQYLGRPVHSYRSEDAPIVIDAAVQQIREVGADATAPVWLPPLPERFPLMSLPRSEDSGLEVPIGLIDDPSRQYQGTWTLDLDSAGGHYAFIGSPQSGRSTALRTVAAGIATTLPPTKVGMYAIDLTGSGLIRLQGFPHVGGIATRGDTERQVRLAEALSSMLREREELFRTHHVESLSHFRSLHEAGKIPQVVSSDIVVLVDGFGLVRSEFTHLEDPMGALLERGGSFGIHLIVSLTRWAEIPMRQQPLVGNRIELRLNDPSESTIARKLAKTVKQPGRVLTGDELFAHIALPTADTVPDEQVGEALAELAEQTATSWSGPKAAPVRILPEVLPLRELEPSKDPSQVAIGLRQDTMGPCLIGAGGAGESEHLLVFGDGKSGKTNLMGVMLRALTKTHDPDSLVVALMSPRDELTAEVPEDFLGGHAKDGRMAKELSASLVLELERRRSGESPAKPHIVAVVDDYDVLGAGGQAPLEPLLAYLPQAQDLGLSVWLTRPVSGASRALYDPAVQMLRDLGATGVLLSGDRSEGQLWRGVKPEEVNAGRARIIRRGESPKVVQIALLDDTKTES